MVVKTLVPGLLEIITLASSIVVVLFLAALFLSWVSKKESKIMAFSKNFLKRNYFLFGLIVSLVATLGSLFYSDIMGYDPCRLCWYQRIFMYPQVLLFFVALWKSDKRVVRYSLTLSIIGAAIALYHYIVQRVNYSINCGTDAASCTLKYTFAYGYITIPMMALTAFVLLIIAGFVFIKSKR